MGNNILFLNSKNGVRSSAAYSQIHSAADNGLTVGRDSGGTRVDRLIIELVPEGEAYLLVSRFTGSPRHRPSEAMWYKLARHGDQITTEVCPMNKIGP